MADSESHGAGAGAGAGAGSEVKEAAARVVELLPQTQVHHANLADSMGREAQWAGVVSGLSKDELGDRFITLCNKYFSVLVPRFDKDAKIKDVVEAFQSECVPSALIDNPRFKAADIEDEEERSAAEEELAEEFAEKRKVATLFVEGWWEELEPLQQRVMMHDASVLGCLKSPFIKGIDMAGKYAEMEDRERATAFKTIHTLTIIARAHQDGEVPVVDEFSRIIREFAEKETTEENTVAFTKSIWKAMTSKGSMSESMENMVEAAGGFDKVIKAMRSTSNTPFKGKDRKKAKKFVTTSVLSMVDLMFGESEEDEEDDDDTSADDAGATSDEESEEEA